MLLLKNYLIEEEGEAVYLDNPSLFFTPQKKQVTAAPAPSFPLTAKLASPIKKTSCPTAFEKVAVKPAPVLDSPSPQKIIQETPIATQDSFSDIQSFLRKRYPSFKILAPPQVKNAADPPLIFFIRSKEEKELFFWQKLIQAIEQNIASVEEQIIDSNTSLQALLEKSSSNKTPKCVLTTPSLSNLLPPSNGHLRYLEGTPLLALEEASCYEQNLSLKRKLWNFLKTFS